MTYMNAMAAVKASAMVLAKHRKLPDYETNWKAIRHGDSDQVKGFEEMDAYVRRQFSADNLDSVVHTVCYLPHRMYDMLEDTRYGISLKRVGDLYADASRFFLLGEFLEPLHRAQMRYDEYEPLMRRTVTFIKKTADGIRDALAGSQGAYDAAECQQELHLLLDEFEKLNAMNPYIEIEEDDDDDEDDSKIIRMAKKTAVLSSAAVLAKAGKSMRSQDAVRSSALVLAGKRGSMQTAAKPELTVKELERVQSTARMLEAVSANLTELHARLKKGKEFGDVIGQLDQATAAAIMNIGALPGNLAKIVGSREYVSVLQYARNIAGDIANDSGQELFEPKVHLKSVQDLFKRLNKLNRNNPTMKKSKKGWYVALGAGTLAVTLVAVGAYFLPPSMSSKLEGILEEGMEFIQKQGNRFLAVIPDWLKNPIDTLSNYKIVHVRETEPGFLEKSPVQHLMGLFGKK